MAWLVAHEALEIVTNGTQSGEFAKNEAALHLFYEARTRFSRRRAHRSRSGSPRIAK